MPSRKGAVCRWQTVVARSKAGAGILSVSTRRARARTKTRLRTCFPRLAHPFSERKTMQLDRNLVKWAYRPYHRRWLLEQADGLFDFFQYRAINPTGGFFDLDGQGNALGGVNPTRGIHASARMVHCFSIGHLLGRPGSGDVIDHGMRYL